MIARKATPRTVTPDAGEGSGAATGACGFQLFAIVWYADKSFRLTDAGVFVPKYVGVGDDFDLPSCLKKHAFQASRVVEVTVAQHHFLNRR